MLFKLALIAGFVAVIAAHGTSYTKLSKPQQSKFDYAIEHSKHGSWHGSAHPHGYGGLGSHGRWRRSAYSKTVVSRPESNKYEYDIDHSKHGSWHGAAHPNGAGGLGDGTGSYQLGGHSKVIGLIPQSISNRYKRSAYSKTMVSRPHSDKYEYNIVHSKHGSWHGAAHPNGAGGLGDGTGSYQIGGHSKVIGLIPQSISNRYKRSAYSKTMVSRPHSDKYEYNIVHSKHGSWHGAAHPNGAGGLGDGTGSYQLGGHSKVIGLIPQSISNRYKRSAYSKTMVSRPHSDKYEYNIVHSKHGSWHGAAHPNGAGGLGDGTGSYQLGGHSKVIGLIPQSISNRYKRSAYSKTMVSRPHSDKYEYDIEHSKHGSWHGAAHPNGAGGLGDGTGSYQLGGHSKVIGLIPQSIGTWGRYQRSAAHGGWSKTAVSQHHQNKYNYDIEHKHHGGGHGTAYPHGYGGL